MNDHILRNQWSLSYLCIWYTFESTNIGSTSFAQAHSTKVSTRTSIDVLHEETCIYRGCEFAKQGHQSFRALVA
ncbi:hypothetical protein [Arabidopsis thaliana]|uniref:Uncharacterized protein AT4g17930 n=3 Tax=Arabidopsis TaxID=3701 RepID=O49692_ARATH|nr:hypothetical protein ISN45_At04g018920 [Arabidopsis thaliana x Arabidopsis arenosa]KAG7620898.1 hypothetical protein ISN44_As04g018490 [Arabidopsis suecica]CAA17136.1 hypothetical protein [Arabidopsis thaliana]CAB78795.1 hypothetical protein [Arabidopsis thaliana]